MRVRVIKGTVWRGGLHAGPGVVFTVPDIDGRGLIASGACELVVEPEPEIPVVVEPAPAPEPEIPARVVAPVPEPVPEIPAAVEPAPKRKRRAKRKV